MTIAERIQKLLSEAEQGLVERENILRLLFLAVLTRQSTYLYGRAGSGKRSVVTHMLAGFKGLSVQTYGRRSFNLPTEPANIILFTSFDSGFPPMTSAINAVIDEHLAHELILSGRLRPDASLSQAGISDSIHLVISFPDSVSPSALKDLLSDAGDPSNYAISDDLKITPAEVQKWSEEIEKIQISEDSLIILKAIASNPDFTSIVANIKAEDRKRAETSSDYINDKELNKAGHSAIIPTGNIPDWKSLSEKERNVAILIFKRFLAIFLPPIIADKTTVITNNNGYTFKTNGKIVVDKGYSILYDTNFKDVQLPTLKKGDTVNVDKFDVKEKVTKPPKRYTDAELVVVMEKPGNFLDDENLKEILKEKKGIGTEATRAGIIEELEKNGYIEKKKGKGKAKTIYVTEQGMFLYHNIKNKDFGKVDMTAIWETKLSEIENDELSVKDFEKEMIQYVIDSIEDIKNTQTVGSFNGTQIATIGTCPKCKNGEIKMLKDFYCCEHYRKKSDIENDPKPDDCDFAFSKNIWGARISENEARKIINGDITKEFTMKKDDKSWTAALWFNPETQKVEFAPRNNNLGTCPCCGGNVKATKDYYLCENYKSETNPSCNFIVGKNVFGASITENDMKQILAGEKTRTLKMHKGDKKWDAQLMYLPEEKKVGFAPRNNETLGTCPCCGGNVKATKDYYLCENYKSETNPSCNFIVGKNVWGANVTENDMKQILAGEKTRTLNMHKGDKKWSAQLMYLPEEKKVGFAPKDSSDQNSNGNTSNIIGVCPCCGKNVKETAKYYLCENYKSETDTPCNFIFGKDIWGAKISVTEAKKILSGKETKEFDMTNGSKKWKAKLVYNKETQKVEFASKK